MQPKQKKESVWPQQHWRSRSRKPYLSFYQRRIFTHLDMVVLGQIMAKSNVNFNTSITSRHSPASRQKNTRSIFIKGRHGTKNLVKHYKQNGLTPRNHGNIRRLPSNTLSVSSVEYVVRFLLNYSDQHGLLLPGRIPGCSRSDIKLLPSSSSKRSLWRVYNHSADSTVDVQAVSYSTFCTLWRSLLPAIIIMKPMTDLCWECQRNSAAILHAANSQFQKSLLPSRQLKSISGLCKWRDLLSNQSQMNVDKRSKSLLT